MRIACLTRYDALGASSRVRFLHYLGSLQHVAPDLQFTRQALLDGAYLRRKYEGRSVVGTALRCYAQRALSSELWKLPDAWWVEKELFPWIPSLMERGVLRRRPYVLDLDDAIFHNYDHHRLAVVRAVYGRKIDDLMAHATLVTAGNDYLAQRARCAGARWVEVLPTVVDLTRYPMHRIAAVRGKLTIGWIGSPATVHYVQMLAEPLRRLAQVFRVRLNLIGATLQLRGVEVHSLPWSEDTEVQSLEQCDIGIMPLWDSPWERGKCGYKIIQYMACGLPVVASPVGVNASIVTDGVTGLLAKQPDDWYGALSMLAANPDLRSRLGRAGRTRVELRYSVQAVIPRLAQWLRMVGQGAHQPRVA